MSIGDKLKAKDSEMNSAVQSRQKLEAQKTENLGVQKVSFRCF